MNCITFSEISINLINAHMMKTSTVVNHVTNTYYLVLY